MLRSNTVVPGGRSLIAIYYKYNTRKVLYFIVTDNAGSTQAGLHYLYRYPDQFYNVAIYPFACLFFMYKFFGSVNKVDNKSRRYDLALKKFLVTRCGWIRLCIAVATGMTIINCWKIFCYGVKRYHYEKLIGIRELLERLALDLFNNTFSIDTGTL